MRLLLGFALALVSAGALPQAATQAPDVVFVPTPQEVVDRMLELAKVGREGRRWLRCICCPTSTRSSGRASLPS